MRKRNGFSLLELLAVLVIMCLLIILVSFAMFKMIGEAQAKTYLSEARYVYVTAEAILLETRLTQEISDEDYEAGLTGVAPRDASRPHREALSSRMNALLSTDITLAPTPEEGKVAVAFTITEGRIRSMTYQTIDGKNLYTIVIADGEATVTTN